MEKLSFDSLVNLYTNPTLKNDWDVFTDMEELEDLTKDCNLMKRELYKRINDDSFCGQYAREALESALQVGNGEIAKLIYHKVGYIEFDSETLIQGWEKAVKSANYVRIRHYKDALELLEKKAPKLNEEIYTQSIESFKKELKAYDSCNKSRINEFRVMIGLPPLMK
ncbi:MAG: hypothetical protein PHN56_01840 [Candidatus Nanoarchaeia archaeon]|nr:hypothetical protein [Candidatus Nanoarchaeia archaeon]